MTRLEPKAFRFKQETVDKLKALTKSGSLNQTQVVEKAIEELFNGNGKINNTVSPCNTPIVVTCNTVTIQAKRIVYPGGGTNE